MGNAELKTAFKNALKDQQSKERLGLTVEVLLEDSLITSVEEFIKEKMSVASLDKDKAFPENNFQVNENSEDLYKRQLISDLNENYLSGFATAESNINSLQEPSFEKYFTVSCQEETIEYTKVQQQKFTILYALFVEKYREQQDKKQNFFEYVKRFLSKSDVNQRVQVGLESGFKFSLSLLKEVSTINKDMLVNSLEYLYQTLRYAEAGSLYSTDKLSFMIDSNLNDARNFLVTLIEDKSSSKRAVELAYKIIFLLGVSRSNVEDFLVVSTLLDKHNSNVDLRHELDLLKDEGEDLSSLETYSQQDYTERKTTKSGSIFYFKAGPHQKQISREAGFACGGNYIYMHQEGLGLLKMGTGTAGQMLGQVYLHKPEYRSGEKVTLLYLNDKLYCRSESLKPKPFVTINILTLEEEKDEFEIEKEDQNLEWKSNQETGRSLTSTPLLSDGTYIYVIAFKGAAQDDAAENREGEDDNQDIIKPPSLVVEVYDPSTPALKKVKEVTLYKNAEFEPYIRSGNTVDAIKLSSFATNGQTLLLQTSIKSYFFDLKTGILQQKVKLSQYDVQNVVISYDYTTNLFYQFKVDTSDTKVEAYTISKFKKRGAKVGFAKEYLSKRIGKFRSQIRGNSPLNNENQNFSSQLNLIERIMMNVTTPILIEQCREESKAIQSVEQVPKLTRALILGHIDHACSSFDTSLEEIKAQGKSASEIEEHLIKFFKYPNATYLTHTLFQQIQENLDKCNDLINTKKTTLNLSSQYSFYFILKILTTNFYALSFCSIGLSDLMKGEAYQKFIKSYKDCIVRIIEEGYLVEFEAGGDKQEMQLLWQEIYRLCLNILSTSINLIYPNITEIVTKLSKQLKEIKNEKQGENCSISLNYLSIPNNGPQLLKMDQQELLLLKEIFKQCCQIKSDEIEQTIKSNSLGKESEFSTKQDTLSEACTKFIKGFSEQLIVEYCALTEQISNKQLVSALPTSEKDDQDKEKLKKIETLISVVFEESAHELARLIQILTHNLKQTINNDTQLEISSEQYEVYTQFMDSIFIYRSAFYQIVTLYVQTFSILKLKTTFLPSSTSTIIQIVSEISVFYGVINNADSIKSFKGHDKLKQSLDSFSRNLSWFIGMTSYKLIKTKDVEINQEKKDQKSATEKMQELIIQSNLFSGGIESRFIKQFSNETQQSLKDLIQITKDVQTQKLLEGQFKPIDDDELLQAIINSDKDPKVDRVIIYMQQLLEKKVPFVPYARIGGLDGLRLSRAAFAVIIKFSEFFDDFISLIDEIDLKTDELKGDKEKDIKLKEFMKTLTNFDQILKRWDSASKMRQWINEKKKSLIEKIRTEIEKDYIRKKEEAKSSVPQKSLTSQKTVKAGDVEQIDTSSSQAVIKKDEEQVSGGLTEDDKVAIDDLADIKFNAELQKIYAKIVEKAEFIVKLQVPAAYLVKDPAKKKEGSLLFIREPSVREGGAGNVEIDSQFDWKDRLKTWRQVQTSKGAITNFTDRKKELFESSVLSILACLQTALSSQRIKKQVETVFLNATKRVAGLNILSQLVNMDLPQKHRYDLMNWFCSSLRANKNQMSHYLDDIKGCGNHLEEQAKQYFFDILKGLVKFVKSSSDDTEIKAILNSLKWKFIARDHSALRNLEIFRILHEGDGKKENKIGKAWGRPLKQEVVNNVKDKPLTKEVIDLFEQIFLSLLGRVVKPDTTNLLKQNQGAGMPKLEKAQSVVDENVSETLISSAITIIFKEFERYIKIIKMSKGVEWTFYVKMRNLERMVGEKNKNDLDVLLLDEDLQHDGTEEKKETSTEKNQAKTEEIKKTDGETQGEKTDEVQKENIDLDEQEKEEAIKKQEDRAELETAQIKKLYSETFLRRLLRLVEIFTNIATVSPYPMAMVQRLANPAQIEILLNLLILSSPRIKIVVLKAIKNLIKLALPFEVFEESISLITKDPQSQASKIHNKATSNAQFGDSKFLKFLYNYLLNVRHKMWTRSGIESEGQYAVTQEIINIFRYILEAAPQQNFKKAIHNKLKQVIFEPFEQWNIEEADIIFSVLPSGSFQRLMIGSQALYKDSAHVIILGFSDALSEDETLLSLDDAKLKSFEQTINMKDPAKQKALVYFVGDGSSNYTPEIRALEITSLLPFSKQNVLVEGQKSILYDKVVLVRLIEILEIEVNKETPLSIRQAQVQILKSIESLIDNERKNNSNDFLNYLSEKNLLKDLLQHIQKNANKPDIIGQADKNLPIDLMELGLTSLRIRALENEVSLLPVDYIVANFSKHDSLTFYEPTIGNQPFSLINIPIEFSINEKSIHSSYKDKSYQVVFFSQIMQNKELLENSLQLVVFEDGQLATNTDLVIQVTQKANIIVSSGSQSPKHLHQQLKNSDTKYKFIDPLNLKPIFIISSKSLIELKERSTKQKNYQKFDKKQDQFNEMVKSELSEWGGFSEEQLTQLASGKKNEDKPDSGVEDLLKLKEAVKNIPQQQEGDIKRLLIGKMAFQTRKQNTITDKKVSSDVNEQIYDDIGIKIWNECFKGKNLEDDIVTVFGNMVNKLAKKSEIEAEKKQQYQNVLDVSKALSSQTLEPQYTKVLNKLLKLHSRKILITFLNFINPLPVALLTDMADLNKLLLIAFNEGIQIRGLTGNHSVLKSIKLLLNRLSSDPSLKDYFNEFLTNQIVKPASIVISRIITDNNFLKEESFSGEVDAQMYPSPLFIYSLTKMLIKDSPQTLLQTRGLIPNLLSVLVGLSFAYTIRAPTVPEGPIKALIVAIKLVNLIVDDPASYKYIDDVVNHQLLAKFSAEVKKFTKLDQSEPSRLISELYYSLTKLVAWNQEQKKKTQIIQTKKQAVKLKKVADLIYNKDPFQIIQLIATDKGGDIITKLNEKILEIKKNYNSHPDGYRVNFIAKIKSLQNSDGIQLMLSGLPDEPTSKYFIFNKLLYSIVDQFNLYYDPEGKYKLNKGLIPNQQTEVLMRKEIYMVHSSEPTNSLMAFGNGLKGRLANGNTVNSQGVKRVNINHTIAKIESAQFHTVILSDKGEAYRCGKIRDCRALEEFESLSKTVKLIAAGRSNIALVLEDNTLLQQGKSKNNHFKKDESAGTELYKQHFSPELEEQLISVSSGTHFTLCITDSGKLYGSGDYFLNEIGIEVQEGKMTHIPLKDGVQAKKVWCSKAKSNFAAIIEVQEGESKYLMSAGVHFKGLLGQGGAIEQSKTFEKLDYDHTQIAFTQVSLLTDHAYALTEKGELYGWGSNDGFRLGFEGKVKQLHKPQPLSFFDNKQRFKILNFVCGEDHSLVYVEETSQFGSILGPRLYQVGNDRTQSDSLHRGVTKEELKEQHNIARVIEFDNKSIQVIGAGQLCSFIYLKEEEKPIDDTSSWVQNNIRHEIAKEIYQSGVLHFYLNTNALQEVNTIEKKDSVIDDSPAKKNPQEESKQLPIVTGEPQKSNLREQKKIQKEKQKLEQEQLLEQKRKARELRKEEQKLELEKIRAGDPQRHGWHFYTQNEIQAKIDAPELSLALKHAVPDLYQKVEYFKEILEKAKSVINNQDLQNDFDHKINCSDCGNTIKGVRYYASYQAYESLKEVNLCEQCFQQPTEFDMIPLVYFRLKKGLTEGQQLPQIELSKLFESDSNFKFELQISTIRKYFNNRQVIIDILKQMDPTLKLRSHFIKLITSKVNKQFETQIISICEDSPIDELENFVSLYKEHEKDFIAVLNNREFDAEEDIRNKIKAIAKKFTFMNRDNLEEVFDSVSFVQNYFTISMKIMKKISTRSLKNESLTSLPVLQNKLMKNVPFVVKNLQFQEQVNALPCGETFGLSIRRRRAMALAESGGCDHEGTQSIFGQLMQELKKNPANLKCFQINSPDSRIFKVEFKGEGSIDAGGPYRDTMTNLCQELQSPQVPLLIPTPNNKNNHGQFRECWTVNPSSSSPTHFEMFTYLGYYIGMAIRSEQALPLDLAPIFWKNILEDHLVDTDQQKELNLKEFDTFSWQVLEDLRTQSKALSKDEFEAVIEEPFVTLLSNGTEVELLPGGQNIRVTQDNLDEYIRLVVNARITEANKQYKAIIEGINFVLSKNIWRILSWKQIEKRATGSKVLDLIRLKEITNYENGQVTEPHIKIFWDVMESFTDEERSLYLKFVWGRARLPSRTESRHVIKSMEYNPKSNLPISHTCFFTLDLPKYPEFQVCRDKILFAIMFCGDIDADRSSYEIGGDD